MDNLTHALMGVGLTSFVTIPPEQRRGVLLAAVLGSEIPDLDLLPALFDPQAQLVYHRGYSHSWLGLAVAAGLLTLALGVTDPRVPRRKVFNWTALALIVHLFFDTLTSYGTWALFPFSGTPLALDVLYGLDLPILLMLGGGGFFYLLKGQRKVMRLALLLVLVYTAGRWGMHTQLNKVVAEQLHPYVYSLVPGDPLGRWVVIVDQGSYYEVGRVSTGGKVKLLAKYDKNLDIPLVRMTRQNPVVESFLKIARHPYAKVTKEKAFWKVKYSDLRLWPYESFNAIVYLDSENRINKIKIGPKN